MVPEPWRVASKPNAPPPKTADSTSRLRVPARTVVIFARQMATLLRSGVPLVRALETLIEQGDQPAFGQVVAECTRKVATGSRLSTCLSHYPSAFPKVLVHMCQIGEETGQLDNVLDKLATWLEKDLAVRTRVRSALNYPLFVLGLSGFLGLLVFYKVMPGFIGIFKDMNIPLPLLTRVVMSATEAVQSWWFWVALIAASLVGRSLYQRQMSTLRGQAQLYRVLSLAPILGPLLQSAALSRYCATVEVMLGAGMKYIQVFQLSANSCGNPLVEQDAPHLLGSLKEGEMVSEYMGTKTHIYGDTIASLLRAGEESSRVPEMMAQAAYYYELDMNSRIDGLSAALEPLMLAGVGLMVGTIVVSVFLPMYSYLGKMGM